MTKVSKKPGDETANPLAARLEGMMALKPMGETALKAWLDIGSEAVEFMSSRMKANIEMQQEMLGCKHLEDIQKVQAEFFKKTLEDYRTETARMMKIMTTTMAQMPNEALSSTKRSYDDVPL